MKIIYRYILRELFYYFLVILFLFSVVFLAYQIYDTRDEILNENPPIVDVVKFIFLVIPPDIVDILPLVAMFAVLFSMGLLAKNKEVLAMIAMGVNFNRLAIPVVIFGSCVGLSSFFLASKYAPEAKNYAQFLYEVRIKGENQFAYTGNDELFRKGEGQRFYIMANYDRESDVMTGPTIFVKNDDGSGLKERIEALRARHVGPGTDGKELWEFDGLQRWTFNADGSFKYEHFDKPQRLPLEEHLGGFLGREKSPDEMTAAELKEYSQVLSRQGDAARLPVYQTAFHRVFTIPLSCLFLALVGYATAVDLKIRNFVLAFSVGLAMGLAYYLFRTALTGMGGRGLLPPFWAAWAPVTLLGCLVMGLLQRLQKVH